MKELIVAISFISLLGVFAGGKSNSYTEDEIVQQQSKTDSILNLAKLYEKELDKEIKSDAIIIKKAKDSLHTKVVVLENEVEVLENENQTLEQENKSLETNLKAKPKEVIKIITKVDTVKITEKKSFFGKTKTDTIK